MTVEQQKEIFDTFVKNFKCPRCGTGISKKSRLYCFVCADWIRVNKHKKIREGKR